MLENKQTVAAVVVTYNRLELLKKCIQSLRDQTKKLDEIIVVNNSSTDGTLEWLKSQNGLTIITQENSGSAGGQYTGIKTAYEKGYDWIWCLDTDIIFQPNALEELLSSSVIKNRNLGFLTSTLYFKENELAVINIPELDNPFNLLNSIVKDNNAIPILSSSFGSLLLPRTVVNKVGLPCKEFFIWGDDAEYTLRIISKKYKGFMILTSKGVHKMDSNGINLFANLSTNDPKFYCGIRNIVYVIIQRNKITHNSKVRGRISALAFLYRIIRQHWNLNQGGNIKYSIAAIYYFIRGILFRPQIDYVHTKK